MTGALQAVFMNLRTFSSGWIIDLDQGVGSGIAADSGGNPILATYGGGPSAIELSEEDASITWQRTIGIDVQSVATDSNANTLVAGHFTDGSYSSGLVAKYNTSGTLQWQRKLSETGFSVLLYRVATDSSDNVYVTGSSATSFVLVKYNSSGTLQWQRKVSLALNGLQGSGITVDAAGDVVAVGLNSTAGSDAGILLKYNSAGSITWQRKLTMNSGAGFTNVVTDASNNIYIVGRQGIDENLVLVKYNDSGSIQWQRTVNTVIGSTERPAISLDSSGNIYIAALAGGFFKTDSSGNETWSRSMTFENYPTPVITVIFRDIAVFGDSVFLVGQTTIAAKYPTSGVVTGTFYPFVISDTSLTFTTPSFSSTTSTFTDAAGTLTDAAGSQTDSAGTASATATVTI